MLPTRIRASALFFQCFRFREKRIASAFDVSNSTTLSLAHRSLHLVRSISHTVLTFERTSSPTFSPAASQVTSSTGESARTPGTLLVDLCDVDGEENRRYRGPLGEPRCYLHLVPFLLVHNHPTRLSSNPMVLILRIRHSRTTLAAHPRTKLLPPSPPPRHAAPRPRPPPTSSYASHTVPGGASPPVHNARSPQVSTPSGHC